MSDKEQYPAVALAYELVDSFQNGNFEKMARILDENMHSYISNAEGGHDELKGRDAFMENLRALDAGHVKPEITMLQCTYVTPQKSLFMLEVKAERGKQKLHNYAAYLLEERDDLITQIHMVEAKPEESNDFWKA
jgi:hypothetical protein